MSRSLALNVAVVAVFVVAVALFVLAAISYQSLSNKVVQLKAEAAALQANKAVTRTALADLQDLLRRPVETPTQTCAKITAIRDALRGLTSAQREALGDAAPRLLNLADNSCSTLEGGLLSPDYKATRAFIDPYINAVSERVAGKPDQALGLYRQALATEGAQTIHPQWRMRAHEGAAYSLMHQGKHAQARAELNLVRGLRQADNVKEGTDYRFIFEDLTAIKLMCAEKKPASEVAATLSRLRNDFDTYARTRPTARLKEIAQSDRRFIEEDTELFEACAYAKVKPA